jgi:hypothetical protein
LKSQTILLTGEPKSTQHISRNSYRGGYSTTHMIPEDKDIKKYYQWGLDAQLRAESLTRTLEVAPYLEQSAAVAVKTAGTQQNVAWPLAETVRWN